MATAMLMNGGIRYGKAVFTSSTTTTCQPGLLVAQTTSGSTTSGSILVGLATTTGDVMGIAYGGRNQQYRPTTKVFAANEAITVVFGSGVMALSADFFTGGSMPVALPAPLYAGTSGTWCTNGTVRVGKCIEIVQDTVATGGTGAQAPYAVVQFNIQPA